MASQPVSRQSSGTSNPSSVNGTEKLPMPSIRCVLCDKQFFKTTMEAAIHFSKCPQDIKRCWGRKDAMICHVQFPFKGPKPSIESILTLILKTVQRVEIICFNRFKSQVYAIALKPVSKIRETKRDFNEKYASGEKAMTNEGIEVLIQAKKSFAQVLNKAQEQAAANKRPGPNWVEVEQKLAGMTGMGHQMKQLKHLILMDEDTEVRERKRLCERIRYLMSGYVQDPLVTVRMFGSSINGFGFKGCDLDILVDVPNGHFGQVNTNDEADAERQWQKKKAHGTEKMLKNYPKEFCAVQSIKGARVPIVKCFSQDLKLFCDLSFKNEMSLLNSQFIRDVFSEDDKFHDLAITVRYWAYRYELAGFTGKQNSTSFSNYALIMMIVFYLQYKELLPSVEKMQEKLPAELIQDIDGWECGYDVLKGVTRYMVAGRSVVTAQELLHGFFHFYADFDYNQNVISPFAGTPIHRVEFDKISDRLQSKKSKSSSDVTATSSVRKDKYWQVLQQRFTDNDRQGQNVSQKAKERKFLPVGSEVVIQDPFELNHNVSKGIGDVGLANWINHCKESAKILDECGLKGNLNDLLKLKLEMPTVPMSKREQKRLNKKEEHDARVEAAKLKTTDKPGRHAFTSAPGTSECDGLEAIEKSYTHKVTRAKLANGATPSGSDSSSGGDESGCEDRSDTQKAANSQEVSESDYESEEEDEVPKSTPDKLKAELKSSLKCLDRLEKRIEVKMQRWKSEDSELEVEPIDSPVEGAQGSAPGTSGKINTELTLALKHLDNLTKKAEHLKSDWTSQVKVVDKKSTTHHKTAKCPPPSSTEAMARESSSSVPNPTDGDGVLNLDQPHLDALSKEEETNTRFAIEVKKAVLCKAMQLEECSVSREMILRYVSKTVRSILRKVLMMEVVPTAIKQELESQKLLGQGLGLELDTSHGADQSFTQVSSPGESDYHQEQGGNGYEVHDLRYTVTVKYPVWQFRKAIRKEVPLLAPVTEEVETAISHLSVHKGLQNKFYHRNDPVPCAQFQMKLSTEFDVTTTPFTDSPQDTVAISCDLSTLSTRHKSQDKTGQEFLKGFLPKMVNVQIAETIRWQSTPTDTTEK